MNFGKVAVLMGGTSAEREISMISGQAVLLALRQRNVDAHPFDIAERVLWDLPAAGFNRVFNILHGGAGEDGTVQGVLDLLRIPYTGSGVMASALAMDKWRTKLCWSASGVPTPRYVVLTPETDALAVSQALGLPLIVKPAREGSSLGVTRVNSTEEFAAAVALAKSLDSLVIAEEFVAGMELTASIVGERALPLVRIEAPEGKYDYNNKYFTDAVNYHCPSGIDPNLEAQILAVAVHAFQVLGCRGWGRSDLILRADGSFSFLEMNTAPGMTGHSLVPIAAKAAGMEFPDLVLAILAEARYG
jgi:D-alanine-D-alanine ligase